MENYLYFRKIRPVSSSVTLGSATQTCPVFTGIGTASLNDDIGELAAISVTSAAGAGTGNTNVLFTPTTITPTLAYSGSALNVATGTTHWIEPSSQAYANGVLVLDGDGTAGGYTLATGDIVTAYWQPGLETAIMYPASALKGIKAVNDGKTEVTFASLKGDDTDDALTFSHANGNFDVVAKMINDACNATPVGKLINVFDGHGGQQVSYDSALADAAITLVEWTLEAGY
tara:strand:- start:45 stop:734 length:690 start_codon:yes stop_codon:yes gene_type:complete